MLDKIQKKDKKQSFEEELTQLSLLASLPVFILLLWVMIYANISVYLIALTGLLGGLLIFLCHFKIHQKSSYQFRSLSNLLDAMNQGDYSLRARASHGDKALNELVDAINTLSTRLNKQRIESIESQLLLNTVITHIDVAIIALNSKNELVLTNPAAKKLLKLSNKIDTDLKLAGFDQLVQIEDLVSGDSKVMPLNFTGQQGKFNVHMETYREGGEQQKLLFITDVSTMLRSEERKAWQSLVRVISHEINNSLSPISSISQSLQRLLNRQDDIESHKEYITEGLTIVSQRTKSLSNFVNSYKQIASLPEPDKKLTSIATLVNKVVSLYQGKPVKTDTSLDVELIIDNVQFEQVLINLIKNSIEALNLNSSNNSDLDLDLDLDLEPKASVTIAWQLKNGVFILTVTDDGTGVSNPDNLFVPFFTTKNQGSGIGLVLCRQIIEAHGGTLSLTNRAEGTGCVAMIELNL